MGSTGGCMTAILPLIWRQGKKMPRKHCKALYEAAPGRKRLCPVPGAGHNNLTAVAGEAYWRALAAFLNGAPAEE